MRDPDLWARLKAYRFDADEGASPFSVKLAEAEGWTEDYTARVLEEYRRFLYLTQVARGEATPSVGVDRAWHMHLTFTRAYWQGLCAEVLNGPLHHDPCTGPEDLPRYDDQYAATCRLYVAEFGSPPPADIWPEPGTAPVAATPPHPALRWAHLWGLGLGFPVLAAAVFGLLAYGPTGWVITGLVVAGLLVGIGVIGGSVPSGASRRKSDGAHGGGVVVGGCGGAHKSGGDSAAGCGGGGCGGGGGGGG